MHTLDSSEEVLVMPSQVTKFIPRVVETHESVIEVLQDLTELCKNPDVINLFAVVIRADGTYAMAQSANIGRHRKLGMFAEMHHNLLVKED